MAVVGSPIPWVKIRRPISNSSWIADRAALQKMLQLCSACLYKLPKNWQRTHHYAPFDIPGMHGIGTCDGCRHDDTLQMFVSTDDPWYAKCEAQAAAEAAIRKADRAFAVNDRRRIF